MILCNINRVDWDCEDAARYMITVIILPSRVRQLIRTVYKCYPYSTLSRVASALDFDLKQARTHFRKNLASAWNVPLQVFVNAENFYFSFDEIILSSSISDRIDLWKLVFCAMHHRLRLDSKDRINQVEPIFQIVSMQDRVRLGQDLNDYLEDFEVWIDGHLSKTDPVIEKIYVRFDTLIALLMRRNT